MQFSAKKEVSTPTWELAASPKENPGSATEFKQMEPHTKAIEVGQSETRTH